MSQEDSDKLSSNSVSLAGEFLVLARLTALGHIATLTLGNTKSVDILLSTKSGRMFRVEVKTAFRGPYKTKYFGNNLEWHMGEKHEKIIDPALFYCFVFWDGEDMGHARFFVVPSQNVAQYVKDQDSYYHNEIPHKKITKHTALRMFRIGLDSGAHGLVAARFENRWDYLS